MGRGSQLSIAAVALLIAASGVSAQDETVVRRLTKHGQLRRGESESLVDGISKRMRRAADMTNAQDPLRMAVSRALYNTPVTKDAMAAAKIRLRLYAGLNEWALDTLFAPRPGGLAQCQQDFSVTGRQCEALIAASGRIPAEEASRLAAGPAPMMASAPMQQQPMAMNRPVAQPTTSRFGRYDSGYRGGAQQPARPMQAQPMQPMQPMARPVARPMVQPMQAAAPTNTRAEYQKRRQEYLERQKREMEARKQKVVALQVGEVAQRGPNSQTEAEIIGADPSEAPAAAKAPAPAKGAKPAPAAAEEVAEAPAEEAPAAKGAALDGDFLDSLIDDPLAKKK